MRSEGKHRTWNPASFKLYAGEGRVPLEIMPLKIGLLSINPVPSPKPVRHGANDWQISSGGNATKKVC